MRVNTMQKEPEKEHAVLKVGSIAESYHQFGQQKCH
jgi:hypothetical protein